MRSFSMAFGFIAIIAVAPAQDAPKSQNMPPAMQSAVRRAFTQFSLTPQPPARAPLWLQPNATPPRLEALGNKCAVPLLKAPIPKDVEFTMLVKKTPKNIDSHIAVPPPIPACPDR